MNSIYKILLIIIVIIFAFLGVNNKVIADDSNPVLKNIHARTSVRSYTDEKISDEILTELVRAGMAAPTAKNMQPWEFIIINDNEVLQKLADSGKFASAVSDAVALIVVMADMNTYKSNSDFSNFWMVDTSLATQNILLAATSMGIGSVWQSVYPSQEKASAIKEVLNIPSDRNVLNIIALGYPDKNNKPKDKWKPEKIFYNSMEK